MNQFISCCFTLGNSQIIDSSWNWSNVLIPDNKLYVVEKGEIAIECNGDILRVKSGEMVLIPALTNHSLHLSNCDYAKKTWIHFSMKSGVQDYFLGFKRPIKVTLPSKSQALKLMREVLSYSAQPEPQRSLLTSARIFELVALFLSENTQEVIGEKQSDIEKAIEYIDNNFTEQLSLNHLAEKYGSSPNHFIKKFKEKTGYTPIKYLAIKKVEAAKKLLETTSLPISSVMEKVGFYDASYFSKLFKKTVGYSPRGYRDNITDLEV